MMLALGRRFREGQQALNAGSWAIPLGTDLYRKTVGVVGFGRIGRSVAQRLSGFEATVLVHTPRRDQAVGQKSGCVYVELPEILSRSDYLTLHAPLTPDTRFLIRDECIAQMKSTAFVINTARGGLVEDRHLLAALTSSRLAGAGLDVFVSESDPTYEDVTRQLVSLPNVIAQPHAGASTREGLNRTNRTAAECVVAVLKGTTVRPECSWRTGAAMQPDTLYGKLVNGHTVVRLDEENVLLYADLHILNEYTSPQAFAGLRARGLRVATPGQTVAVVDHIIPTHPTPQRTIADPASALQATNLKRNCEEHGIPLFDTNDPLQGIEHIIAPELGMIRPGMVVFAGTAIRPRMERLGPWVSASVRQKSSTYSRLRLWSTGLQRICVFGLREACRQAAPRRI